jgi:integrase
VIETAKTLTAEQIMVLLEESKDTPIHMQVLFNVLMGLRRQEINGVKYSDVDYINRTLSVERQLGTGLNREPNAKNDKSLTKQELELKTDSSNRVLPIPDIVFEAILEERKIYEKNRNRRKKSFQDLDYICCSSYGRPRSKDFHWSHYKALLKKAGLPNIRWHDLRSTFCTLLLRNDFSPKAVSKLMGHAKEIITMDVYGDNANIIPSEIPEMLEYMEEVMPELPENNADEEILDGVGDIQSYLDFNEDG